jgi:hypothetical protein
VHKNLLKQIKTLNKLFNAPKVDSDFMKEDEEKKDPDKPYYDQLSLVHFIEQWLDIVVTDAFKKLGQKALDFELMSSGHKVLSDLIMILAC